MLQMFLSFLRLVQKTLRLSKVINDHIPHTGL